ncbi:hypothetical protein GCM10027168_65170 [Streptomyces capparidis]
MGRRLRTPSTALAAAAAAALLASCGSSGQGHSAADEPPAAAPPSSSAAQPPASPEPRRPSPEGRAADRRDGKERAGKQAAPRAGSADAATSARTAARPPWCGTDRLTLSLRPLPPAAGNRYAAAVLTNGSATACRLQGYVGLRLLDGTGAPLPTDAVRDRSRPSRPLTLAPGASAWARLHWSVVPGEGDPQTGPCAPPARRLQVTPPDSHTQEQAAWTQGAVCGGGRIEVLPLAPGTGG